MKYLILLAGIITMSFTALSQGKSHDKGHGKKNDQHATEVHGSNKKSKQKGYSKNQPKKVQAALMRDYPNATNISWDKYKGDYTATFNNGIFRSTAVYHANGDRRDTRTILTRQQLPGTFWDRILRRDNITPKEYIQIERPSTLEKIFRILSADNTAYYYDQNGNRIRYNY